MYKSLNILKSVSPEGVFQLNRTSFDDILKNSHPKITLQLPISGNVHSLELEISQIFNSEFYNTYTTKQIQNRNLGAHYQGKLSGFNNSSVAMSFTDLGVSGFILDGTNQYEFYQLDGESYQIVEITLPKVDFCSIDKHPEVLKYVPERIKHEKLELERIQN